jgi:uncharacterized membrane protein HdeD (DUF308 family)
MWWLLASCGIVEALLSATYLIGQQQDGSLTLRKFFFKGTFLLLCRLAMIGGVFSIAAGLWKSASGRSWPLVLNGLALSAFGFIPYVWRGPASFRPWFSLLLAMMAASTGIIALTTAQVRDKWFFGAAGAAAAGFALAFLALAFSWITLPHRPEALNLCIGSYFALAAICLLGMALRLAPIGSLPGQGSPHPA